MLKLIPLSMLALLGGCISISQPPKANVSVADSIIYFEGFIQPGDFDRILALNISEPKKLVITSSGGDIEEGIKIGEWIYNNKMDVEVLKGCMSSCANYIFPAGKAKLIHKDSILVWHGGVQQPGLREEADKVGELAKWTKLAEQESELFEVIGVNASLTTCGYFGTKMESVLSTRTNASLGTFVEYLSGNLPVGFDYSVTDLSKFGVSNIVLVDGEWNWRQFNKSAGQIKVTRESVAEESNKLVCD
ncbi:hypothetical protein L9G16_07045 [Shewanella sp. A25]|nr:hypothetical protein [Shewanella shenzhenensis]